MISAIINHTIKQKRKIRKKKIKVYSKWTRASRLEITIGFCYSAVSFSTRIPQELLLNDVCFTEKFRLEKLK